MPSKKYQHLVESGKASLGRKERFRTPAKSILIVCEGKNTEKIYFEGICQKKASSTVKVKCYGAGFGDATNLVKYALKLKTEQEEKAESELGMREAAGFDEIWIVFDADYYLTIHKNRFHKLTEGVDFAKAHAINVALSNPCFEFWLLLHLDFTTSPMSCCDEVVDRINGTKILDRHLNGDDLKKDKIVRSVISIFVNKVEQAVTNAQKVRHYHETSGCVFPPTPSTDVDKLICSIVETIPPAHKGTCCESCK